MAPSLEFCFESTSLWLWSLLPLALLIRILSELLEETGTYATFLQRLDGFCVDRTNHKLQSLILQCQSNLIQSPLTNFRPLTTIQICNYARHTKKPVLTRSRAPLHKRLDLGRQNEPISTSERYRIRRGNHFTRESKRFYQIYLCINATPAVQDRTDVTASAPWTFQKAHTYDYAEVFLQDNELIYLKSGDSGRYLAVEIGVPSIVDRMNFMYVDNPIDPENDGIRWTVR